MSVFSNMSVSFSGIQAERQRMQAIAENLAHINTTRTQGENTPYQRKEVIFEEVLGEKGVQVAEIIEDDSPPILEYRPDHPDADEKGYVKKPNIDLHFEMADMMSASRAYQANLAAVKVFKNIVQKTIDLG